MIENIKRAWLLSLLTLAIGGPVVADDEKDWYLELEAMPGYHSNYFFRGDRAPAPDTNLFSLYALGEKEKKSGKGKFTFGWDVGQVWVLDIDNADYFDFNVGLEYQRGASKWQGEIFHRPNQVFEEEGAGVFYDLTGVELGLRQGLRPGLWIGFSWEYEQQDYDRVEDLRDANVNSFDLSLRYPLSERWGLRGTLVYESKDANAGRYSNNGAGAALALEGQPSDRVQLFMRYKFRQRNYDDAQPGDRNFEREDDVQDIIFNITWRFTQRWGVRLEDFYRTGSSTRPDRNYSGNRIYAGIVYRL
jgi:hypothetical protein